MAKLIVLMSLLWLGSVPGFAVSETGCPAVLNHVFPRLQDAEPQNLCQYRGKVVLVVNTASRCGFTRQYDGLEKLYSRLGDRGLVVLGFPANDFGAQEPGNDKQIADFCRTTYGVQFPMLGKSAVTGTAANPLYRQLAKITGDSPEWNFHKYLIDREGNRVLSFSSDTAPEDPTFVAAVEKFLAH